MTRVLVVEDEESFSDAVSFLLSAQAGFITGHSLYVDGGWLAYGYF